MLDAELRNIAEHLHLLSSKMPGFQDPLAEVAKLGFMQFCHRLLKSVSKLVTARRHGTSNIVTGAKRSLREIILYLVV